MEGLSDQSTYESRLLRQSKRIIRALRLYYVFTAFYRTGGGVNLVKCGLCGAEVKEQPKITAEGKCSVCGAKLAIKK